MPSKAAGRLEYLFKVIGIVVTVGGLVLGLTQFIVSKTVEAQKPYLEKKLAWCEEATNTAAALSTRDRVQILEKEARFWELYWGVMGLVENAEITNAMVEFGKGLLAKDWSPVWRR